MNEFDPSTLRGMAYDHIREAQTQPNNKMKTIGLFHTPKDIEELQNYLSLFNKNDATIANTCAWMAWNLACKIANEEKTAQDAKQSAARSVARSVARSANLEIEVKGEYLEKK